MNQQQGAAHRYNTQRLINKGMTHVSSFSVTLAIHAFPRGGSVASRLQLISLLVHALSFGIAEWITTPASYRPLWNQMILATKYHPCTNVFKCGPQILATTYPDAATGNRIRIIPALMNLSCIITPPEVRRPLEVDISTDRTAS